VIALLVQNLERLDESVKEEADGVHNTLGTTRASYIALPIFWMIYCEIFSFMGMKFDSDRHVRGHLN